MLVFDKLLLYCASLAGPVSIGASSPAAESTFGRSPGAVSLRSASFRSSVFVFPYFLSLNKLGVLFSPLLKPSFHTLFGFSAMGYWSLYLLRGIARLFGSFTTFTIVSSTATIKKQLLLKDKRGD